MASAISKFPNELLSEILEASYPDPAADPICIPLSDSNISTLVTFSQVCSKWRLVAHEPVHAHLWKNFSLYFDADWFPVDFDRLRSMLNQYLRYAPPVISFCVEIGWGPRDATRLRRLLAPHAHRLDSLTLYIAPETLATFLDAPPLQLKCLQKLSIVFESAPEEADWDRVPVGVSGVFAQVPELTDVSISVEHSARAGRAVVPSFDLFTNLPFAASLTSVTVTNIWLWPGETKVLFTRCSQLVCCTLWCDELVDDTVSPGPVILPNLRQLDITFLRLMSPRLFVDLTAPQLEDLTLTGGSHAAFPCEAIVELVKRSNCDLKVLRLRSHFSSRQTDIPALLRAAPNLHTLELRLTPLMDYFGPDAIMHRLVECIGRK